MTRLERFVRHGNPATILAVAAGAGALLVLLGVGALVGVVLALR